MIYTISHDMRSINSEDMPHLEVTLEQNKILVKKLRYQLCNIFKPYSIVNNEINLDFSNLKPC